MKFLRRVGLLAVAGAGIASAQPAPERPVPDEPVPEQPAPIDPSVPTVAVRGRVIDALGRPVRNATVTIEGTLDSVKTGRDGWFRLRAPIGVTLVVDSKTFGTALATVTGELLDEIVLLTESQLGETITVESEAPSAAPGAAQLDRKELQRIPGTGGDIVRALTVMPGVVNLQIPLGYSGVVIRGSSPQDSKVLIDDFEVPVLFHNIGFRAVVPAETIATLDYIPGGFDVAYGRATSGIVSLTTRAGDEKRSTQAEISVIDGGLLAQGPAGGKSRYLFALRRSTIDFVLPSVIPDSVDLSLTTVPRYYDGQLRLDHQYNDKWALTLSSIATDDTFELFATKNEDAKSKRFYNRTRFVRLTASARYKEGPWQANLALSGMAQQFLFEAGLYQKIDIRTPTVTPRFELTRSEPKAIGLKDVVWRVGAEIQSGRGSVEVALPEERREGEPMPAMDPEDTSVKFNGAVWVTDFAAWTAVSANFDPRVRVTTGVRAEYYVKPDEFSVQPRGEIAVKVADHWKVRLSAGAYRRPPEYQSEFISDTAKSERSKQTIIGLQYEPREGVRVQASAYYTDRSALITHNMDNTLGNNGRGKTTGGELLATYRGGPWFGWLSYSYSRSTRIDGPGEDSRLFDFDQPH
ncbi:MAG: TonB-dependent receptor, partial [Deltaproteobacteria bacterium]|nr:TonB-dependent receptor [Deltaproteobacteria bacterium]